MSNDALVLISGEHDDNTYRSWMNLKQFEPCILHIEQLCGVTTSAGKLEFDLYTLPDDLNVKKITGAVIADCRTGDVARAYGFQVPFEGLGKVGDCYVVSPRNWCFHPEQSAPHEFDCSAMDDPCALAKELWCCYLKLTKERQVISISFRDMQKRYQPFSKDDREALKAEWLEAKHLCDKKCGRGSELRGAMIGHSCAHLFH